MLERTRERRWERRWRGAMVGSRGVARLQLMQTLGHDILSRGENSNAMVEDVGELAWKRDPKLRLEWRNAWSDPCTRGSAQSIPHLVKPHLQSRHLTSTAKRDKVLWARSIARYRKEWLSVTIATPFPHPSKNSIISIPSHNPRSASRQTVESRAASETESRESRSSFARSAIPCAEHERNRK